MAENPIAEKSAPPLTGREALLAALLLAVLLAIFFWPAVLAGRTLLPADLIFQLDPLWQSLAPEGFSWPGNQLLFDQVYFFYPWAHLTATSLNQGHLPLWNPYLSAGQPFMADGQSALFSPFTWIATLFPLNSSFTVMALLPLWVAGFFTFLLAREIGLGRIGALVAAITFTFSGPLVVWAGHPLPKVFAWLPALLFFSKRALAGKSWPYTIAVGATIALQFLAGHPETSFHVLLAWAAFCVYWAVVLYGWRLNRLMDPLARVTVAGLGGLAGAAVQLAPLVDMLRRSTVLAARGGMVAPVRLAALFLDWHSWPPAITALLPQFLGTPLNGSYWYPFNNYNENTLYAGVLPLALALIAALWLCRRRARPRQAAIWPAFFLGLAVFSLGIALRLPLFNLVNRLPLFSLALNGRMRGIYDFSIAILAGFGLERVSLALLSPAQDGWTRRVWRAILVATIILTLATILASTAGLVLLKDRIIEVGRRQVAGMQGHPLYPYTLDYYYRQVDAMYLKMLALFQPRYGLMFLPVAMAGAALLLTRLLGTGRRVWALGGGFLLLIFADLFLVGGSYNPTIPPDQVYPTPEAISFLQRDQGIYRVVGLGRALMPNSAMVYQLSDVRGYDPMTSARETGLLNRMAGSFRVSQLWLFMEADSPLLDLFNVKYVLTDQELAGKWTPVYRGPDGMAVYENQAVMPRAFVVYGAETVAGPAESLARLTDGAFDYRTTALLEGDGVSSAGADAPFDPNAAVITRYEPERVEVVARAASDGFLVLSDSYDPGWRAELDGRPAQVYAADHAFRAVPLPAGEHRVVFTYDPPAFQIGLVVSLLAWAGGIGGGIGLALAARRRRAVCG